MQESGGAITIVIPNKRSLRREESGRARAKGRVLCDPIIARLARFLIELRHYQE